jgi:hypothetical protein
MEFEQRLDPELAISHLQTQVDEISEDLKQLHIFVTGNGDPTKGLLWLASDLGRLIIAQSKLTEANRQTALEEHSMLRDTLAKHLDSRIHLSRGLEAWPARLAFDTARQALSVIVAALLFLVLLGTQTWIREIITSAPK